MGRQYIGRCVEALEKHAGTVLAFAGSYYIDDKGSVIERVDIENPGSSETPSERFRGVLYVNACHPFYGVMRTEILKQTRLLGGFAESDRTLLVEMGLEAVSSWSRSAFSQGVSMLKGITEGTKTSGRGR